MCFTFVGFEFSSVRVYFISRTLHFIPRQMTFFFSHELAFQFRNELSVSDNANALSS